MSNVVLYLVHAETKRKFQVLGIDREKQVIRLKGEHAEFDEKYDPQALKRLGYALVQEQVA